ncbi:MAG: hypothetical protein AAFV53_34385 [Myxococcota bacterium]
MELSAADWALFTVAAGAFMTYHAWFFFATSIRSDRAAADEAAQEQQDAWERALETGDVVDLEDARKARELRPRAED